MYRFVCIYWVTCSFIVMQLQGGFRIYYIFFWPRMQHNRALTSTSEILVLSDHRGCKGVIHVVQVHPKPVKGKCIS